MSASQPSAPLNDQFRSACRALAFCAAIVLAGLCGAQVLASASEPASFVPGSRLADLPYRSASGTSGKIYSLLGTKGMVLITRDTECPVSQRYVSHVVELAKTYGNRGFQVVLVDVTPHDLSAARAAASSVPNVTSLHDRDMTLSTWLGAKSTAEAFLVDSKGTLRYRGAIDDQYGLDYQRAAPRNMWLRNALDAVSAGEEPRVRMTEARGCPLALKSKAKRVSEPVTYHNRISRIIQNNCQACHRVGGLGPMPLETYEQVFQRRAVIDFMVKSKRMPPWQADPHVGEWANDRSLSDEDRGDLLRWIAAGAPQGNPADAPLPVRFFPGWNIGKPDYVLPIPEPVRVPAHGVVDYVVVYAQVKLDSDRWISAVEIRPSQPKVVHHVLAFIEAPGRPPATSAANPPFAGILAATGTGSVGVVFPEGMGKKLPKNAWIKFEIHYQPNGTEVTDRTEIGFRFSKEPVKEVRNHAAYSMDFAIPPHASRFSVKGYYTFTEPGRIISFLPHMHLRGAAFRYELKTPDGKAIQLLNIPRYDFNWQTLYTLKTPLPVPAGSQLVATGWFDNSRANPWNPDPNARVQWGPQTTDEMMIGYFDFVADRGPIANSKGARPQKHRH